MTAEQEQPVEGVRVNDRRRIDPLTYAVREQASPAPASAGVADAAMADSEAVLEADLTAVDAKVVELTDDLRRVHAEYANYRKRVDRDREAARDVTVRPDKATDMTLERLMAQLRPRARISA